MMVINNKYEIGQLVYLRTDQHQLRRIVLCVMVFKGEELWYKLACADEQTNHTEFEISDVKDLDYA